MATAYNALEVYERMKQRTEAEKVKRAAPVVKKQERALATYTLYGDIFWSDIMNGDLSPATIVKKLLTAGYKVIAENVKSPVGKVPKGSTVLTDANGKRAVWIDGRLYQKQENGK